MTIIIPLFTFWELARVMFMTLVFIGCVWYLAKICSGACREASEEICKLRKVVKEPMRLPDEVLDRVNVQKIKGSDPNGSLFSIRLFIDELPKYGLIEPSVALKLLNAIHQVQFDIKRRRENFKTD